MKRTKIAIDGNEAASDLKEPPEQARQDGAARWKMYETWASMGVNGKG
jgi:hypothetical protein